MQQDWRNSAWARFKTLLNVRSPSLRHDLQEALEAPPAEEGEENFSVSERTILQNVLKLGDMRVDDVMIPRADIEAVEADINLGTLIAKFREAGHSRMPVFEDSLDNVVGMVHIKDVLEKLSEPNKTPQGNANGGYSPVKLVSNVLRQKIGKLDLLRKILFVPPSMPVTDLLQSMQATHMHMAMVIDEYGGTDGLVTIEDLLEAVVGDIEDEHDESGAVLVRPLGADVFVADARIELSELVEAIGPDFDPGVLGEEVDTLGGLIFALVGRVPVRGEVIPGPEGFEFQVTRADARRVRQVRISRERAAGQQRLLIAGPRAEAAAPPAPQAVETDEIPSADPGERTGTA